MPARSAHWSDAYVLGLGGALVAVLAGAWLAAAPFVFAYQPEGAEWVDATKVGVAAGIGLGLAGLAAGVLVAAGLRAEFAVATRAGSTQPSRPGDDDLDRALVEVTTALLADLRAEQSSQPETPGEHTAYGQALDPQRGTR